MLSDKAGWGETIIDPYPAYQGSWLWDCGQWLADSQNTRQSLVIFLDLDSIIALALT